MSRTHKYTWEKRQIDIPDVHSRDYNNKPVVNLKGHQSSGAWAPELWCPLIFLEDFLMVFSHLCWQCFEKTRKCQEHINTLRKKEKLIFLKPILDIKTKTCWSSWKGTKVLVPPAFLAGLSWKNMPTNAGNVSIKPGNIRNTIVCLAKKCSGAPFSYMASWKWVTI